MLRIMFRPNDARRLPQRRLRDTPSPTAAMMRIPPRRLFSGIPLNARRDAWQKELTCRDSVKTPVSPFDDHKKLHRTVDARHLGVED